MHLPLKHKTKIVLVFVIYQKQVISNLSSEKHLKQGKPGVYTVECTDYIPVLSIVQQ